MKEIDKFLILYCLIVSLLFHGCQTGKQVPKNEISINDLKARSVCVMPFLKGKHHAEFDTAIDLTYTCHLSDLFYLEPCLKSGAEKVLTRNVQNYLKKRLGDRVIPFAETDEAYQSILKTETDTARSLAKKIAEKMNVDYVIVGTIWRYQERTGTAASIEKPASVAFAVYLLDVNNGKKIWNAYFDKTQKSLSEDFLQMSDFFKQGAKWVTADELARLGVKRVFKKCPLLKM